MRRGGGALGAGRSDRKCGSARSRRGGEGLLEARQGTGESPAVCQAGDGAGPWAASAGRLEADGFWEHNLE